MQENQIMIQQKSYRVFSFIRDETLCDKNGYEKLQLQILLQLNTLGYVKNTSPFVAADMLTVGFQSLYKYNTHDKQAQ